MYLCIRLHESAAQNIPWLMVFFFFSSFVFFLFSTHRHKNSLHIFLFSIVRSCINLQHPSEMKEKKVQVWWYSEKTDREKKIWFCNIVYTYLGGVSMKQNSSATTTLSKKWTDCSAASAVIVFTHDFMCVYASVDNMPW